MKIKIYISIILLFAISNIGICEPKEYLKTSIDTTKIINEFNATFSFGGESKLALMLPKFEYLRIHKYKPINFYYGASLGIHAAFVTGYGSLSAISGVEYKSLDFSTSLSHFLLLEAKVDDTESIGPFSQDLINFKIGIRINDYRIRIGTSFILNESIPTDQDRAPLLDWGKIGDRLWLIEFQTILSR